MIDLISKCESMGNTLSKVGGSIHIENAAHLPGDVKAALIEQKAEILAALDYDEQARAAGVLIGIPGTLYLWPVSRSSTAYMEKAGGVWTAYRESYIPGKTTANSIKIISEGNTFEYIFSQYTKYIDYVNKKRGEK